MSGLFPSHLKACHRASHEVMMFAINQAYGDPIYMSSKAIKARETDTGRKVLGLENLASESLPRWMHPATRYFPSSDDLDALLEKERMIPEPMFFQLHGQICEKASQANLPTLFLRGVASGDRQWRLTQECAYCQLVGNTDAESCEVAGRVLGPMAEAHKLAHRVVQPESSVASQATSLVGSGGLAAVSQGHAVAAHGENMAVPVQEKRKVESSDTRQTKKQKRQHNNTDYARVPQAPISTASGGSAVVKHPENSVHLLGSIRGSEESTIALQTVQEGVDRSEKLHSDSSVESEDHRSGAVGSGSEYSPGGDAERSQGQASTSQDVEIVSQAQPTQPDEQLDLQSDPFLRVVLRCISVIRYSTHNLFQMQDAEEGAKRHLARLTLSSIHALRRSALTLVESRGAELARAEAIGYERGLRDAQRRYSKEK